METQSNTKSRRRTFEDVLITLCVITSAVILVASFWPLGHLSRSLRVFFEVGRLEKRAVSLVLLFGFWNLRRRKRSALVVTELSLAVMCLLQAVHLLRPAQGLPDTYDTLSLPLMLAVFLVELFFLISFFVLRRDFCFPSSRRSLKRSILILAAAAAVILMNVTVSYSCFRLLTGGGSWSLAESLSYTFNLLFTGDTDPFWDILFSGLKEGQLWRIWFFERTTFWFSWICFLGALVYAFRPWILGRTQNLADIQHARTLLRHYGQNSCSYLALEDDKLLYFGQAVDGVIPYGAVGSTIIVNGDPVCADEDFPALLAEFRSFCERTGHDVFFLSVTDHFLDEYRRQGFGLCKMGEEARFKVAEYSIAGKKGAKMRMNINRATREGVTVKEYKPLEGRDLALEAEFERVSREWLGDKKSSLLVFTMGTIGLDNPMDKRYFYAEDSEGRMCAFIVYVPFLRGTGYMADVTRHGDHSPSGVMEKIQYEAFQTFAKEGYTYASLGVAPLAGLEQEDPDSDPLVQKLLKLVYDRLNDCYGFRDLYRAKEKYNPSEWVPAYYAFLPRVPTPKMFYAVVKIQNPQGISDYVRAFFRGRHEARLAKKERAKKEKQKAQDQTQAGNAGQPKHEAAQEKKSQKAG